MELKVSSNRLFLEDTSKIEALSKQSRKMVLKRVGDEMKEVKKTITKKIRTKQSKGRKYGSHYASLPGFPPNRWTGALSKAVKVTNITGAQVMLGVDQPEVPYGYYLEFGTKEADGSVKMEPRPFFYSTITEYLASDDYKKVVRQIYKLVRNELSDEWLTGKGLNNK